MRNSFLLVPFRYTYFSPCETSSSQKASKKKENKCEHIAAFTFVVFNIHFKFPLPFCFDIVIFISNSFMISIFSLCSLAVKSARGRLTRGRKMSLKLRVFLISNLKCNSKSFFVFRDTNAGNEKSIIRVLPFTECSTQFPSFSLALNSKTERWIDMKFNYWFPLLPRCFVQSQYIPETKRKEK